MKKLMLFAIFIFVVAGFVFAQSYTVQSVTGRVQREAAGSRIDVKAGDTLSAETVINTGIGSTLILKDGEKTLSIPAARSGKVAELATMAVPSGIRISGNVIRTNTSEVGRTTGQVSTASARASDAAGNENIATE